MVAPSKPTVYIVPATEDDYDQFVEWEHTVLERNDPVLDHVFTHPERATEDTSQTREMFTDPSGTTFKAVLARSEGERDLMVGYVTIRVLGENWIEEEDIREAKKGEKPLPNRVDPKTFCQFVEALKRGRRQFMGGKRHILVRILCVDPAHQRMGVGSALMKYVMQLALDAKVPVYVEATKKASSLYERLGFEVVERLHIDIPGGGTVSFPAMAKNV